MLHSNYDQPDVKSVHASSTASWHLTEKLPTVADHLEEARPDILTFAAREAPYAEYLNARR
jgi:putative transposase